MHKNGFTLLEILIGLGLVATVFSVAGSVLFASLKSTRKAAAVAVAKAEGAYAMRAMSDMIRYAQAVTCQSTRIQVDRPSQQSSKQSLVYSFDNSVNPAKISSTSGTFVSPGPLQSDLTSSEVRVSLTECGNTMFNCSDQNQVVEICFAVDSASGVDVSDKARGTGGLIFQTQVTVANRIN